MRAYIKNKCHTTCVYFRFVPVSVESQDSAMLKEGGWGWGGRDVGALAHREETSTLSLILTNKEECTYEEGMGSLEKVILLSILDLIITIHESYKRESCVE